MENNGAENIYKIIILESNQRRVFHPKLRDNFLERVATHKKSSGLKKCLFGKADSDYTKRLLQEDYLGSQKRFIERFELDIETIEHLERSKDDPQENIENDINEQNREVKSIGCDVFSGPVKNLGRKILTARRKVNFSKAQTRQSQQFITDFYQARKNSLPPLENKETQQKTDNNTTNLNC